MGAAEVIPLHRETTPALERTPPMDLHAEATVLSDIVLGGREHFDQVKDFLRPEHFYGGAHRLVFQAMCDEAAAGNALDAAIVLSRLKQQGRIEQLPDGAMFLRLHIVDVTPAVANVVPHARIIHDRWRERQAVHTCMRIAEQGYLGVEDTQNYLDEATRSLAGIARLSVTGRIESNVETVKRLLAVATERSQAKTKVPLGIATGLPTYDEEWGGLHGGEVTAIVARPGAGKTSIGVQLLSTVSRTGIGVLMFSQDSPRDDLMQDLLSHEAKVDSKRLRNGTLSIEDWRRVADVATTIGKRTFWIDDTRAIHVGQVRSRALAYADEAMKKERRPLGLVIVDYIQQLKPTPERPNVKKHEWIGHAANEIKTLARAMKVPIVVLAQQKRPYNGKQVWEASDCSEIEKEADNLFFIEKTSETTRRLRCDKVRRGSVRTIDLAFDRPSRTFTEAKLEAASRQYVDRGRMSAAAASAESDDMPEPPPGFFDDGSLGALVRQP
jgi:replicative DNA helicase